jgi:hypothetical protein
MSMMSGRLSSTVRSAGSSSICEHGSGGIDARRCGEQLNVFMAGGR